MIPSSGIWTLTAVRHGYTYTDEFSITSGYSNEITISNIPVGGTVTPNNSVRVLLDCADLFNVNYTALSELLADSNSLSTVINSNNAIDYLVRSTSFASDVTANSTAMQLIGADNYASDTLLGNETWLNAICNSAYFESVLNDKVPTMTSDILPNGECSAQSFLISGYEAYKAFDGNDTSYWQAGENTANSSWIQYKFDNANKIKCVKIVNNANYNTYIGTLQASSDGNVFTDMKSNISVGTGQTVKVVVENLSNNSNLYYRMQTVQYNYAEGSGRAILNTIQFYCRKDV